MLSFLFKVHQALQVSLWNLNIIGGEIITVFLVRIVFSSFVLANSCM